MTRLGSIAKATLPARWYTALYTLTSIRTQQRYLRTIGVDHLTERVWREYGGVVQLGPFAGMRYVHEAVGRRHIIPCLVGTYEQQLWPAIALAPEYDPIVVIGSGEGYYAVGLARMTGRRVHAFDANPGDRRLCRKMAAANGVDLSLGSWCTSNDLTLLLHGRRGFLLCDIEGGEFGLFQHSVMPSLTDSVILVELHGDQHRNSAFAATFQATHTVEWLSYQNDGTGADMLGFLGADAPRAAAEYRNPAQRWILCRPRHKRETLGPD